MKYLVLGLVLVFSGLILGILEWNETIANSDKFVNSAVRPVSIKKLLAPYLITLGLIFTFAGVVSISFAWGSKGLR